MQSCCMNGRMNDTRWVCRVGAVRSSRDHHKKCVLEGHVRIIKTRKISRFQVTNDVRDAKQIINNENKDEDENA